MNNQTEKAKQLEADKARRIEEAKVKLIDGTISAISVDTCIFTANGYYFEKGVLKHLEQFKTNTFQLVFSEVTLAEIHSHITNHLKEAKEKLLSGLRGSVKHWAVPEEKQQLVAKELLGKGDASATAATKLKEFLLRCDALKIDAKSRLDIDELLRRYFQVKLPFEASADKKTEFPDAITLLTLEAWAKKHGKAILFVTKDNGCKCFCDESNYLYAIDSLTDALSLIQQRDTHLSDICNTLETKFANGQYPNLLSEIEFVISSEIGTLDFTPDAESSFNYDAELDVVELKSLNFDGESGVPDFSVVDYRDEVLIVKVIMQISVETSCNFIFTVHDSIDREDVIIGNAYLDKEIPLKVDVLLSITSLDSEIPSIENIELVYGRRILDFGRVEPDYGDEDPNSENY